MAFTKEADFEEAVVKLLIERGWKDGVLKNYTEYKTSYQIVKKTEDDPSYKLKKAKSQIAAFALSDPQTVEARSRIIVGHFLIVLISVFAYALKECGNKAVVVKWLEIVNFFAHTDKLYRNTKLIFN